MTGFEEAFLVEGYVDLYDKLDQRFGRVYRACANRLVELAAIGPGISVIDIGAGTGTSTLSAWSAMKSTGRLLAIDPSLEMLRRARAKPELAGVMFRRGYAQDVAKIAMAAGMAGEVDAIISSFTYYYTYGNRRQLYQEIESILKPGGRWIFNLTRYLGVFRIRDRFYNEFSMVFERHLRAIAQQQGIYPPPQTSDAEGDQFLDAKLEEGWLKHAGFTAVGVEAWPLPLAPSDAYRFTIDGFYRHGSNVSFAEWLMRIPLEQRTQILLDAVEGCSERIDGFPRPHIANFWATKL